jgi:hypothetical protein
MSQEIRQRGIRTPDLRVEPLEIRSNGERVFEWTRFTGHGADSGVAMEMDLAHVLTYEPLEDYGQCERGRLRCASSRLTTASLPGSAR